MSVTNSPCHVEWRCDSIGKTYDPVSLSLGVYAAILRCQKPYKWYNHYYHTHYYYYTAEDSSPSDPARSHMSYEEFQEQYTEYKPPKRYEKKQTETAADKAAPKISIMVWGNLINQQHSINIHTGVWVTGSIPLRPVSGQSVPRVGMGLWVGERGKEREGRREREGERGNE